MAITMTAWLVHKIVMQSNIDIFFIDWEQEKEILIKNASELKSERFRGAWRTIFLANQFNEIQKERNISLFWCLDILVFFW